MVQGQGVSPPAGNDYSQLSNILNPRSERPSDNACVQNMNGRLLCLLQISSICHVVMHGRCRISQRVTNYLPNTR
jgi:hypothetical protein